MIHSRSQLQAKIEDLFEWIYLPNFQHLRLSIFLISVEEYHIEIRSYISVKVSCIVSILQFMSL